MLKLLLLIIIFCLVSVISGQDSTATEIAVQDSITKQSENQLKSPVSYKAEYISLDPDKQTMHLRGEAKISYEGFTLISGIITVDWSSNLVYANPDTFVDSTGVSQLSDFPIFIQSNTI